MDDRHTISEPRPITLDENGRKEASYPAWEVDILRDNDIVVMTLRLDKETLPPRYAKGKKKNKIAWKLPESTEDTDKINFGVDEKRRIFELYKEQKKLRKKELRKSSSSVSGNKQQHQAQQQEPQAQSNAEGREEEGVGSMLSNGIKDTTTNGIHHNRNNGSKSTTTTSTSKMTASKYFYKKSKTQQTILQQQSQTQNETIDKAKPMNGYNECSNQTTTTDEKEALSKPPGYKSTSVDNCGVISAAIRNGIQKQEQAQPPPPGFIPSIDNQRKATNSDEPSPSTTSIEANNPPFQEQNQPPGFTATDPPPSEIRKSSLPVNPHEQEQNMHQPQHSILPQQQTLSQTTAINDNIRSSNNIRYWTIPKSINEIDIPIELAKIVIDTYYKLLKKPLLTQSGGMTAAQELILFYTTKATKSLSVGDAHLFCTLPEKQNELLLQIQSLSNADFKINSVVTQSSYMGSIIVLISGLVKTPGPELLPPKLQTFCHSLTLVPIVTSAPDNASYRYQINNDALMFINS